MAHSIQLTGKPICITGASSGIGRATAIVCAKAGMPVMVAARREDKLQSVVEEIRSQGGHAELCVVDVTDADACERMIESTVDRFGSIYAVFANAGYGVERAVHEMNDAELRELFEVNFFGSLNAIRPALPRMTEQGAGHVVWCSSCLAKFTIPYYGAYCATKAAQCHLGRAMRIELAPKGVQVSTVHPVGTRTEFTRVVDERSDGAPIAKKTPERFMQSPQRVAKAVVRCLRKPRAEVWTSRTTLYSAAALLAFPGLADRLGRSMGKQRGDTAAPIKPV